MLARAIAPAKRPETVSKTMTLHEGNRKGIENARKGLEDRVAHFDNEDLWMMSLWRNTLSSPKCWLTLRRPMPRSAKRFRTTADYSIARETKTNSTPSSSRRRIIITLKLQFSRCKRD